MPHLLRPRHLPPALRPPTALRLVAVLVLGLLAGLAPASRPARAQNADAFAAHNIQVDVSADNVAAARERALMEGQRRGLAQVLQRLSSGGDPGRLPKVSDAELQNMVLDVGIDQEKRSNTRYLATLSVRFRPDAIRRLLRSSGVAYADWRGRPVAVLPVWRSETGPVMLDAPNPWRDAWKSGAAQGVVPLVVPQPPASRQADYLAGPFLAAGTPEVLTTISQRYNTPDVIDAVASAQRLDNNRVKVDVVLTGQGPVGSLAAGSRSYTGEPNEPLEAVMRRAVEDIAKSVNEGWKSAGNVLQFDRSAALAVVAPLSGNLADWVGLRERLTRSTPVRSFEVAALSKSEAALVLHYVGDQQQLETSFAQNGLSMTWAEDHWILQTAGPARAAAGVR